MGVDQIMIVQPCRQLRTELIDQLRKCFLGDVLRWSCLQVDHSGVLVHVDNVRHIRCVPAGENIHFKAALAKPSG